MGFLSCCKPRRWRNEVSIDDDDFFSSRQNFAFRDLAIATHNFGSTSLIGEGGFGKVFKGQIKTGQSEQTVAIKVLDKDRGQGNQEFLTEVLMLSLLNHCNLVSLIGYCIDGDQRVLVYEFMPKGSLDNHLFDLNKRPLEWNTRINIALGAARGLEYLHCIANPPVIHRDMKSANVLLDAEFKPKLSDFGLAKLGPVGAKSHVTTRVLGSLGYCAPDYNKSGKLTFKSDVYSFGVVLLELITGRRAYDTSKRREEKHLVNWARHFFKDRRKFGRLVDPRLQGQFPKRSLEHLLAITSRCLQDEPRFRPTISDVLVSLEHLAAQPYNSEALHSSGNRSTSSSSPLQRGAPIPSQLRY